MVEVFFYCFVLAVVGILGGSLVYWGWRFVRMLSLDVAMVQLGTVKSGPQWVPTEGEISASRLRRAVASRRDAELSLWESEFHALLGDSGGCSYCARHRR